MQLRIYQNFGKNYISCLTFTKQETHHCQPKTGRTQLFLPTCFGQGKSQWKHIHHLCEPMPKAEKTHWLKLLKEFKNSQTFRVSTGKQTYSSNFKSEIKNKAQYHDLMEKSWTLRYIYKPHIFRSYYPGKEKPDTLIKTELMSLQAMY